MLRITAYNERDRRVLKLEGRLSGVWVAELESVWRTETESGTERSLSVDLCDVDAVDTAGRSLLALMHEGGVRLVAKGCGTRELVREITGHRHG